MWTTGAILLILLQRTGKAMVKHLTERPDMPVDCATPPQALRRELAEMPLLAEGMAANDILGFLESKVMPWSMPTNHARSYAWVNTSPAPISILSDALAVTLNNGLDGYHHSAIYLMHCLGRWLMELSGFIDADGTPNGMAILLAGGSARKFECADSCSLLGGEARWLECSRGRLAG